MIKRYKNHGLNRRGCELYDNKSRVDEVKKCIESIVWSQIPY